MKEYNEERPHDALNNRTPWEYLVKFEQQEKIPIYTAPTVGKFTLF